MITDEQVTRFLEKYAGDSFLSIESNIRSMPDSHPDKEAFYGIFMDKYVESRTNGFLSYGNTIPEADETIQVLNRYLLSHNSPFIEAYRAFLKGQHKKCLEAAVKSITPAEDNAEPFGEEDFILFVLCPYKNAFPGFYRGIRKACDSFPTDDLVKLLCERIDEYYKAKTPDDKAEVLYPILQRFPDSFVANMLLGYAHFEAKRWGSAIACFEKTEGRYTNCFFWEDDVWQNKAWAYGKMREHKNSIECYKKALEIFPEAENALNNLGYEYYLMKQYKKALEIFQGCLEKDQDVKYAANNYVRTLLAMGRNSEAKAFISEGKFKVIPALRRRALSVDRDRVIDEYIGEEDFEADESVKASDETVRNNAEQFSSEKLLEDELSLRIDSGRPVFGKNLKIYRRHGEYGRQYIIPIGRLDLLAEDEKGDLYIIELKKDSGYDDPYDQTTAYLEWFEKNHKGKNQNIYGIICLNNPGKALIEKVRKDDRIQLFNYSISYDEVK